MHCSVSVSETQLHKWLPMLPIGPVVGVGFLLLFMRRTHLRKGRSIYVDTVLPGGSVQPNLRKSVQTLVELLRRDERTKSQTKRAELRHTPCAYYY